MPRPSKRKQQSRRASQRGFEESESEEDTSIVVDVSSDDSEAECEVFLTPEHTLHKLCAFDVLLNASTLSTGSFNVPRVGKSRSSKYRNHALRRQHELQFRDHRKITTFFSPAAPKVVDTSESDTDAEEYVVREYWRPTHAELDLHISLLLDLGVEVAVGRNAAKATCVDRQQEWCSHDKIR